jgi:uncharacterized protein YigA (DUF484 family)
MPFWLFALIIVVISSVIGAVYFIMNEKGKEKLYLFDESKTRLENMAQQLETLMFLAKDNLEIHERIKQLQNQIAFANPSEKKQVASWDERIKSQIADLKIALVRAKSKGIYHSCNRIITQIELFLIERQEKID